MEWKLEIDDRAHAVAAAPGETPGTWRVVVDGTTHDVAECGVQPGSRCLVVDGRREPVHVASTAEGTWVWHAGRARLVRDASSDRRRATGDRRPPTGLITPAFPSVVVAVLVQAGEAVRKGQPLVVVSAMKMESRLVAPHAGTVRAIRVAVGASVKPGDELVEVEPAAEGARDG